jgi:hypothetical protein
MDPLMVVTAPAVLVATVRSSLIVILAVEAVTAGAPTMGLAGEPGAEATAAAEATRTATPPALHAAALTPAKKRRTTTQEVLHGRRQRWLPRLLRVASQSTSPGEIQTSRDHQVRREAGSSALAQMLRPLRDESGRERLGKHPNHFRFHIFRRERERNRYSSVGKSKSDTREIEIEKIRSETCR